MDLKGKVAFITGGARGLGKAYGEALLERGAKVFLGDLDAAVGQDTEKELGEKFGPDNVKFTAFDVTDLKSFEDAFAKAVSEFGNIDIMVNNAGVMNESIWEKMIQLNVSDTITEYCAQMPGGIYYVMCADDRPPDVHASPFSVAAEQGETAVVKGTMLATEHMRKDKGGKGGRIINISSRAGLLDQPFTPIYCGTKHAVRSYTCSLALNPDNEAMGVEFAVLCPGPTATDLILKCGEGGKVHHYDVMKVRLDTSIMDVAVTVNAFLQLVQLEKMNGKLLYVQKEGNTFERMEHHSENA